MGMTWKQFKEAVDRQLSENGISEDEEIWYIDISFPQEDGFEKDRLGVSFDERLGISIN